MTKSTKSVIFPDLLYVCLLVFVTFSLTHGCPDLNDFTAANSNCRVDSSCLHIECTGPDLQVTSLAVSNCEDPVRVDLNIPISSGHCNRTYSVSGDGVSGESVMDGQLQLNASFTRNASHLQFHAFSVLPDGQISSLIPRVTIPLSPATCMCSSINKTSKSFNFPLPHTCLSDARCNGFHCNISYSNSLYVSHYSIDPCKETLQINISNSDGVLFDKVVNQSRTLQVPLGPATAPLYIKIVHYNYSIQLSVILKNILQNITVLPLQQIILDRSSCDPFIPFNAAPVPSDRSSKVICNGSQPSTQQPTPSSRSGVSLAIAVSVPIVCVIFLGGGIFAIAIVSVLLFYHHKRKRTIRFRRMAFDEAGDEDI